MIIDHVKSHAENSHACDLCENSFEIANNLASHKYKYHVEEQFSYEECERRIILPVMSKCTRINSLIVINVTKSSKAGII